MKKKFSLLVALVMMMTVFTPFATKVFAANAPLIWWDGVAAGGYNWGGPGINKGYCTEDQTNGWYAQCGAPPDGGDPCIRVGINTDGNCSYYQEYNQTAGNEVNISQFMDSGYLVFEVYIDNINMLQCQNQLVELNTHGNDSDFIRLSFDGQITEAQKWTTVAIKLSDDPLSTGGTFDPTSLKGMRIWFNDYVDVIGEDLWDSYATDNLYFRNVRFQDTADAPMPREAAADTTTADTTVAADTATTDTATTDTATTDTAVTTDSNPQTGDATNYAGIITAAAVCVLAAGGFVYTLRRKSVKG